MDSDLLKIGELAEQSGVLPVTLRAWERRYGLLKPQRTPKGHRLYPRSELDKVAKICRYLAMGVSLGEIKKLLAGLPEPVATPLADALATPILALAQSLNVRGLRQALEQLLKEQPLELVCSALWQQLEQWPQGPFSEPARGLLEGELSLRLAAFSRLQQQQKRPAAVLAGQLPLLWRQMVAAVLSQRYQLIDLGDSLDDKALRLALAALNVDLLFLGAIKGELPAHHSVLPGAFAFQEAL
ncbi:MerR family transcriptional regulator [Gallaecimonas xiamenensis]|uniref:MerR family transcriptional regulator n=1 Tax=Gallaecimonas xiamenensis 3-C-1 TaxID=745411 RepID=K2JQC7_9GAMM|nr:MerR family transcriptional regulator [Gallaecimonas xiamenensis]EKE76712.1 MerR family transcriptional regulator [Gallaecimonas xiamenensis 3-C-1]